MQVKIVDGSLVEITAGQTKVVLAADVFGLGFGPFLVVGFDGELPVIRLVQGAEGEESKDAPVDGGLILSVDNPDEELEPVGLPSGEIVKVPASVAPILKAFIEANESLMSQLAKLLSGEEIAALKAELDAVSKERDALKEKLSMIDAALPVFEEAKSAIDSILAIVKG